MNIRDAQTRWRLTVAVVIIAAISLGAAVVVMLDRRESPPIIIDDPIESRTIAVSLTGAVATPGIYRLTGDVRVQDAIDAAGGTTADADLSGINVARRLNDEEQIAIPRVASTSAATGTAATTSDALTGPININTATEAQLETLPDIGPVLAQRIIDYRAQHGPFASVGDLAAVDGISDQTVANLTGLITVGP